MKVFFPRHISGGWFNLNVQVGVFQVSLIQMLVVALGIGLSLVTRNTLVRSGLDRLMAALIALPLLLITIFVAFFRYSELSLIPFVAKLIRTYFLGTTIKYQVNYSRPDPILVAISRSRKSDHVQLIEQKIMRLEEESIRKLKRFSELEEI